MPPLPARRPRSGLVETMRVAVIGSGITGLGAAIALAGLPGKYVTLYECDSRLGGHAHTIDIDHGGTRIAVDTGFIVYNELNYPNLSSMFRWAGVETIPSDMSFSLSSDQGAFEWCGRETSLLNSLFAQRRNALDPSFYRFLVGIDMFQRRAMRDNQAGTIGDGTLGEYLDRIRCYARVRDDYILPMGAAIWSMSPGETLDFPARSFLAFFDNHRLLHRRRPLWRTVKGGSRFYVEKLAQHLGSAVLTGVGVQAVEYGTENVVVRDSRGNLRQFDAVILATHAPTTLALLKDPTPETKSILGAFRVSRNRAVVHRDIRMMPKRRQAWASWNLLRRKADAQVSVTYWMNLLQSLPEELPLFVTLNPEEKIREDLIFKEIQYDHPIFDSAAISAQSALSTIQGRQSIYFAGAWTAYGFHEDGLRSGLAAAEKLGGIAPWLR
ncbi:COG2907 Predicted NAD/FAD-binding protein [Rhabdaerophilaceae bacterium]